MVWLSIMPIARVQAQPAVLRVVVVVLKETALAAVLFIFFRRQFTPELVVVIAFRSERVMECAFCVFVPRGRVAFAQVFSPRFFGLVNFLHVLVIFPGAFKLVVRG